MQEIAPYCKNLKCHRQTCASLYVCVCGRHQSPHHRISTRLVSLKLQWSSFKIKRKTFNAASTDTQTQHTAHTQRKLDSNGIFILMQICVTFMIIFIEFWWHDFDSLVRCLFNFQIYKQTAVCGFNIVYKMVHAFDLRLWAEYKYQQIQTQPEYVCLIFICLWSTGP